MFYLFIILILSYLAGSIPTAIMVSKVVMKDDIRNHGSGNAGATNVFRVMGWKPALFVVLVDIGKGTLATMVFASLWTGIIPLDGLLIRLLAGLAAIVGHIWTVFAGFRGGKGMGTAFGVLIGLAPTASLVSLVIWLILVFATRIVSIGSLSAGLVFPGTLFVQKYLLNENVPAMLLIMGVLLGILVFVTHRSNIGRLIRGEENRFGSQTKSETSAKNNGDS